MSGQTAVVGVRPATATGAGDRAADDDAVEDLDHRLRGRADDRHLRVADEVHVGAGVHLSQATVEIERIGAEVEVEPL
jgi:hypothetical protein